MNRYGQKHKIYKTPGQFPGKKLINSCKRIHNSKKNIYIFADKTTNIYFASLTNYKNLTTNNVTYKKAPEITMNNINMETKEIPTKLNTDHKISSKAEKAAFITVIDPKPNFKTKPSYRLINPTTSEIERISQTPTGQYKHAAQEKIQLNQWKNTKAVTNWFTVITNKSNAIFIQLDMAGYYPSITECTLDRALKLAAQHVRNFQEDIRIIKHCCKSLLFPNNKP